MSQSESSSTALSDIGNTGLSDGKAIKQFVTMEVGGQLFGIPVQLAQDILKPQEITPIPLAESHILGAINLRGRIVTVIDMRTLLDLPKETGQSEGMYVVVDYQNEQYSLAVDKVGEVLNLPLEDFEHTPINMEEHWKRFSLGVYRLSTRLMIVINIEHLINRNNK